MTLHVIEQSFDAAMEPFTADVAFKGKPRRHGKPWADGSSGASWSHRFKRFIDRITLRDRRNDWYAETVTDPTTGQVIHHCEEPLSKHLGHGSAKNKNGA